MINNKKIYIVAFSDEETMTKFAKSPPEDTKIRCVFKKKNSISVEAGKTGFCKIISEGLLPDEIIE